MNKYIIIGILNIHGIFYRANGGKLKFWTNKSALDMHNLDKFY